MADTRVCLNGAYIRIHPHGRIECQGGFARVNGFPLIHGLAYRVLGITRQLSIRQGRSIGKGQGHTDIGATMTLDLAGTPCGKLEIRGE